jgi:hypothetical protein
MKVVSLNSLQASIAARKAALGVDDSPAATDAMRNRGYIRTPQKRELLGRAKARAVAAGVEPVPALF